MRLSGTLKVKVNHREIIFNAPDFDLDCGEHCKLYINLNDENTKKEAHAGDNVDLKFNVGGPRSLKVLLQAHSNVARAVAEPSEDVKLDFLGDLTTIHDELLQNDSHTSFEIPDNIEKGTYNIIFDFNLGEELDRFFVTPIKII